MQNKIAFFWIRFLARAIDMLLVIIISYFILFFMIERSGTSLMFKSTWMLYVWGLFTMFLFAFSMVIFPLFIVKGKTIGMLVCRIQLIYLSKQQHIRNFLIREIFFSGMWIFLIILALAFINHTLIDRVLIADQTTISYTALETLRISVISAIGSIIFLLQVFLGISIIVRPKKQGFHDLISKTSIVWINKFNQISKNDKLQGSNNFEPISISNKEIEWI